ncbi:MAG TPA: hypothetical protein VJH33_02080 [Candidatus Paceibacterota bacterium]
MVSEFRDNRDGGNSYALSLRQKNPEKMQEIEKMVVAFSKKVLRDGEILNDAEIGLVANFVANQLKRKIEGGATETDMNEIIEGALYAGVDTRLKLKERHQQDPVVK